MGTQQFCLKWNNHQSNMLSVFEQLLSTEALVDVTLACDGLSLKAHKMVLSACSPYFQSLFLENPCKHPIVIMKDMRYTELKAIIDFMYRGEVNVSHDQLNALLRTAETLKVKGLAEVSGENRTAAGMVQQEIVQQNITTSSPATGPPPQTRSDSPTLLSKRKRGRPRKRSLSDSNRSDDEQIPSKIKEPGSPEIEELSGDASIEANDISLSSNSQTQVHQSLTSSSVHNSHINKHPSSIQSSHDSQVEEPPSDDGDFEVEPSKLMEQTLTTDVPVMSNSTPQSTVAPSVHIVPLSSSSGLDVNTRSIVPSGNDSALVPASASIASDSLSSSQMQGPDSPQDIKPALLSFEEPPISPVAGPSQDRSMMMYMDTSGVPAIPGTSYQDNQTAIVQHESQPQVVVKQEPMEIVVKQEPLEIEVKQEPLDDEIKQELDDQYVPVEALPVLKNPTSERAANIRYTCQICPFTTTSSSHFQSHFLHHSSQTTQQCPKCGKLYKNLKCMNAHLATHDMERNFTCVYCEKKFKRKSTLNQHIKLHLDADRFKCIHCDKVLQSNAALKRHISSLHILGPEQH